jgi:hypothetical protein
MACELNPLTWKKFEKMHSEAWENGWTYGPAHTELYLDYLKNWDCFMNYLNDVIKNFDDKKSIKILIGEAPPFWVGNSAQKDRSYFYNIKQTRGSTWLNAPFKYFHYSLHPSVSVVFISSEKSLKYNSKGKQIKKLSKLNFLAKQGVVLLDIFPFPIRQTTKIRETITSNFSKHFKEYFEDFYKKVKIYISCKTNNENILFEYALVTPIFTGLQILYGSKSKDVFEKIVKRDSPLKIINFDKTPFKSHKIYTYYDKKFIKNNSFKNFFGKIAFNDGEEKKLDPFMEKCSKSETPLLMDASGNVNFSNFFNSDKKNLTDKIGDEEKDEEDIE